MTTMRTLNLFIVLSTFYNLILAGSTNTSPTRQCSTYCTESKLFRFTPGTSYKYSYTAWTETSLEHPEELPNDRLWFNSVVTVTALSPCEIVVDMSDVNFSGGERSTLATELSRDSIRASVQNGRLETICVPETQTPLQRWSLNVKRSILSTLQISLRSTPEDSGTFTVHETDVSGTCRAEYSYDHVNASIEILRKKNLALCSGRSAGYGDVTRPLTLDPSATLSSRPLLRGHQSCTHIISDSRLEKVVCKESHIFQPFSNGNNGAHTYIEYQLNLEEILTDIQKKVEALPTAYRRTSLLYEHENANFMDIESNYDKQRSEEAMTYILGLLDEIAPYRHSLDVQRNTAQKFGQLVKLMRNLPTLELLNLTVVLPYSDAAQELVLDALPILDTAAATATMATLYTTLKDQAPQLRSWLEHRAGPWFASLASSRRPTTEMLQATLVLLKKFEEDDVPHEDATGIVLGISGLAHALCEKLGGTLQCSDNPAIRAVVISLERIAASDNSRARIIAIKGLGNIGVFYAEQLLQNYYQDSTMSIELRLAAMDAFRRAPCSNSLSPLLSVYMDTKQDSEVRIAAYLAAVRCPSALLLRIVKRTLYSETVNQVGSFVWTHLTNSQESRSKSRQILRSLIANEFLQNKFRTDVRQFSRNFEFSKYFETLGIGATVDSNVIFSTKSYLPRSAMLNFTIDLFGESVNLLEVGGRAEGMEPLVQRLLSKQSVVPHEPITAMLRKSDSNPTLDAAMNLTSSLKQTANTPKASTYVRLFGNEVSYKELEDMLETSRKFDVNPSIIIKALIDRKKHTFSRSIEIIDSTIEVPTGIGLPLRLTVNGMASVSVTLSGNLENKKHGIQINGKLAPSANIAMTGTMAVGDDDFKQGIKFEAMMFTHTSLDSRFKFSDDGKFNFQSEMPDEKQTVIEMTSQRFIFNGDKISKLPDLTKQRETYHECTADFVDKLFGVKICSEISYPNATLVENAPYFPLSGDAFMNITITKTDPNFKTYDFSTSWSYVPGKKYDFGISYDRLGSSMENRRRVVQALFDRNTGVARFTLDLPEKQAEIALNWDNKEFNAADLVITYDREVIAYVLAKLSHQPITLPGSPTLMNGKYEPELKFKIKGLPQFSVDGVISYIGKQKMSTELKMLGFTDKVLTLMADYARDNKGGVEAGVKVDTPWITWVLQSSAKHMPNSLGLRLSGSYNTSDDDMQHTVALLAKHNWNEQGALRRDNVNLKIQLSQWPRLSGQVIGEMMRSRGYYEVAARATLLDETWNVTQRVQSVGCNDVWFNTKIQCPQRGVDFHVEHRHKLQTNSFTTSTRLHVDPARQSTFHLDYKRSAGNDISFITNSSLLWPGITFSNGAGPYLESRLYQSLPGHYLAYMSAQWTERREALRVNVTSINRSSLKFLKLTVDAEMAGALGFTKDIPLIMNGKIQAEKRKAEVIAILSYGTEEQGKIVTSYELDMQHRHEFKTNMSLWQTKKYEFMATVVNRENDKSVAFDMIMSRHIAFDFQLTNEKLHYEFYWNKAERPDHNVTLNLKFDGISLEQGMRINGTLLVPQQHIKFQLLWAIVARELQLKSLLSWLPDREVTVTATANVFDDVLEAHAELSTSNVPVMGSSRYRLSTKYTSNDFDELTVACAWGKELKNNMNYEINFQHQSARIVVNLKATSTLWHNKEFKLHLTSTFKNWTKFFGRLSGIWGSEEVVLRWELGSEVFRLDTESSWSRIPTCGMEIRLNVRNEITEPLMDKYWVRVDYENNRWEAILTLRRQNQLSQIIDSAQLHISTPLKEYSDHTLNVTWTAQYPRSMEVSARLITSLIGDYGISCHWTMTSQLDAGFHVMNADTTILRIDINLYRNAWQSNRVNAKVIIPELCNVETIASFVKNDTGFDLYFKFKNNRKLLHEIALNFLREQFNESSIVISASFSGYSYLILTSKWDMEIKHAGSINKHTSFLKVNEFILDHQFAFMTSDDWNFYLIGKTTTTRDILNITLLHENGSRLFYYFKAIDKDIISLKCDLNQGFIILNMMNNVLQINTRFRNDDEFTTFTEIIVDYQVFAQLSTSSYLRYDDDNLLESMVITGDLQSGEDSAILKINLDAGRQITGLLNINYAEHKGLLEVDLLSVNNTIGLSYSFQNNEVAKLKAFVLLANEYSTAISAAWKTYAFDLKGHLTFDEEQNIILKLNVDCNVNRNLFPVSVTSKLSVSQKSIEIVILDTNKAGISISGQINLESNIQSCKFKVELRNHNDPSHLDVQYDTRNGLSLIATYETKLFKYHGEVSVTDKLIQVNLLTPFLGLSPVSFRLGILDEVPNRVVLDFTMENYTFNAEMFFNVGHHSQVIIIAKSSEAFHMEAAFNKIRGESFTDCLLVVDLNGQTVKAGALLEYTTGMLNITTNMTWAGETAHMTAGIQSTEQTKSFDIGSQFRGSSYLLHIYSSSRISSFANEQGFKVQTPSFNSEFKYETSTRRSRAYLKFQDQEIQCTLDGNVRKGDLVISQMTEQSFSNLRLVYNFEDKIDATLTAILNEKLRVNIPVTIAHANPLFIKAIYNPKAGKVHFSIKYKTINYLADGSFIKIQDRSKINIALESSFFEKVCLNISYKFEDAQNIVALHIDYGSNFLNIFSEVLIDGTFVTDLNIDIKSSLPKFKRITFNSEFQKDSDYKAGIKLYIPDDFYIININLVPDRKFKASLETSTREYEVNYEKLDEQHNVLFVIDKQELVNAEFILMDNALYGTVLTPYEKYRNMTLNVNFGANIPSKRVEIHRNNELLFKAQMYPVDNLELQSGTGIIVTFFEGDEKLVYDAQYSINNPLYIILKQHETENGTRDILHFNLNVTDENTAFGEAVVLLPIAPYTKILATGYIQINDNNAEFKVSYKIDEEQEHNFSISYHTFIDNFNIYHILTNISTPFEGYESISLKMQSGLTETIVNFISPFSGYENIKIISVHRLDGHKKELQVQYQNMDKRIFYLKALFDNHPTNKLVDLETRSPFLNGQVLIYSNSSVMGLKLEHNHIILIEIDSRFIQLNHGHEYQFLFKKPDKIFELSTRFQKESKTDFSFTTVVDNKSLINITFLMSPSGHITAKLFCPNNEEYLIVGDIDWNENALQLSITGQEFKIDINFAIMPTGYVNVQSTLLKHSFAMSWKFIQSYASLNLTSGTDFILKYIVSDALIDISLSRNLHIYAFQFGKSLTKGWDNIKLHFMWDSAPIVDFQHQFLTEDNIKIETKLVSPYLGTYKTMKFEVVIKTKDILSVEAEYKWRPKDISIFRAQLEFGAMNARTNVYFKSPFTTDFKFHALYEFSTDIKTMEIFYQLSDVLHLKVTIIPNGSDQKLNITLVTPIRGYTHISVIAVQTYSRRQHIANLQFRRESFSSDINIVIIGNELKAVMSTPKTKWVLAGNYDFDRGKHTVTGVFQWGTISDIIRAELVYNPSSKLLLNIDAPNTNYKINYESEWTNEKKSIALLLKRNEITAEINIELVTTANVYMFVAFTKSPFFDFIRITSVLDAEGQELRGSLAFNETDYSIQSKRIDNNKYNIDLYIENDPQMTIIVSYNGTTESGLKFEVLLTSPYFSVNNTKIDMALTLGKRKSSLAFEIAWGENLSEIVSYSYQVNAYGSTEITTRINTIRLTDFESYIIYDSQFISLILRNQSETIKGRVDYQLNNMYSINCTFDYNNDNYVLYSYFDPSDNAAFVDIMWPKNQKVKLAITLKPGEIDLSIATPFVYFSNIQASGKYSEYLSNNLYQISSSAQANWDEYSVSLQGSVRNLRDNYGITGTFKWGHEDSVILSCDVLHNKTLVFDLRTPFKGLPHIKAKLEALKYRHISTGIRGEISTPFIKFPQLNFSFNYFNNIIEAQFSFDTLSYKNISIETKFSTNNRKHLFVHLNTPFINQVKQIRIDAKSDKVQQKGYNTKIFVYVDQSIYELQNNYTLINGKLDSSVYLRGPSSQPISFKLGGKFIMNSFSNIDVESYFNEDIVALKYDLSKNALLSGKIYLPTTDLWQTPTSFELIIIRDNHFEGKLNYNYGGVTGNALVKNKLTRSALETVMYLNLPNILKYPLQLELNANYIYPRLQFNGYASFMAEHRLSLTMAQHSFRTALNAHLSSAFFKGTRKFSLDLTSNTLSVVLNDEIRVTGSKKSNQLILTLSQLLQQKDHTLTYSWELLRIPKFEVSLESPILTAKKATFSATYMGLSEGINLKLTSGTESMHLDYGLINQYQSKGIKVVVGNENTQILNFAATLVKVTNGHEVIADLRVLDLNYKITFNYTLHVSKNDPILTASLRLKTPILFPMKILNADLKAEHKNNKYLLTTNILFDEEEIKINSQLKNDSLIIQYNSSLDYISSGALDGKYKIVDEMHIIEANMNINNVEIIAANTTFIRRPHSIILECHSKANIEGFEEFRLKLTIPSSELKYNLTANIELLTTTSEPFKAYFVLSSRSEYTSLDFVMTGLSANIHLTPNQGDFSYKTGTDDYRMRMYSKASGHELHSAFTVNSGSIELLKASLFGMYLNHTDFYILMSTTSVYETMQNVVFYVGAEKSQLRFGAEYEGNMNPAKQSYTVTINHHVVSLIDFDIGLTVENSARKTFVTKLTHILKSDFYVALAQINESILKITKINQDQVLLGTVTAKHDNVSIEMSLKLILNDTNKGIDIKVTHDYKNVEFGTVFQIGGFYKYNSSDLALSFDFKLPFTKHISFSLEFTPRAIYIDVTNSDSALLIIDFDPLKVRSKYILVNLTVFETKFMLSEFNENSTYELSASALIHKFTYQALYKFGSDYHNPGSYKCNATLILPTRSISLHREKIKSTNRNLSEVYLAWENLDQRIGYSYEMFQDNFKKNVIVSIEIPNRALQLKTHHKYMVIDDNLTDVEYGIQFNWNTKIHSTPVTLITSMKYNSQVGYVYIVLAHPSFNSTFVINGEIRRLSSQETHFATKIGTLKDGVMKHMLTTALNITGDESISQYRVMLLHSESGLHQIWSLKTDTARGLYAKLSLLDAANNKQAAGIINYAIDSNRLDVSVSCQESEMKLSGQVEFNERYGLMLMGSYNPWSDPVSISVHIEELGMETIILTTDLSVAKDRNYIAEARFTPTAIIAHLIHHEYSASETALHIAVVLSDTETLTVNGRYHPEVWSNITKDLIIPYERTILSVGQLSTNLREMIQEEVILRLSNLSNSVALTNVFRRVMEDTKAQWAGLHQDLATVRILLMHFYDRDDFYIRTTYELTVSAISQGTRMLSSGWSSIRDSLYLLFTRVLPDLFSSIYRYTIEPVVQELLKFAPNFAHFMRKLPDVYHTVHTSVSTVYRTGIRYARDVAIILTKYSTENAVALNKWVVEIKAMLLNDIIDPWMEKLADLASEIEKCFEDIKSYVSALPISIEEYFLSLEEIQAIIAIYKQYANWLEEILFAEIVTSFREVLRSWYAGFIKDMYDCFGEYVKYITMTLDLMKGSYDEFITLPPVVYFRMVYARVNQKLTWLWNYWDVTQTLTDMIISIGDQVILMLMNWSNEDFHQQSSFGDNTNDGHNFYYDRFTGDFATTIPLPFIWPRFDQRPNFGDGVEDKFENFRYAVMDRMYHMATEYKDWTDAAYRILLPPFSSSALITVSGHIITFDGHHYKVKDQLCGTYLLAADYHDYKFAVMVNYGNQESNSLGVLKSVTLFTQPEHQFNLAFDLDARDRNDEDGFSKLTIDMKKVEIPARAGSFSVERDGQMVIITGEEGIALRCNVVAGICSLELSGWFHGRVAGIAGSLDRELGNDIITPAGESPTSIFEFLNQWRVPQDPQCSLPASNFKRIKMRTSSVCSRLFKKTDSPLQPCFKRLDPEPFRLLCDQDFIGNAANRATGEVYGARGPECLATEAYVEQCKFVGMMISMPANCIRCRLPSGKFLGAGEVVIYDAASNSTGLPAQADIVFLIERSHNGSEHMCLQTQDLAELPAKLESVLRGSLGITSVRFAIVSFGAKQEAAIHTQEGLIWGGKRNLQRVLSNSKLESRPQQANDRDLLNGLMVASSRLSFRAGASKTIILVPCFSCSRSDETATVFAEATNLLLQTDVKLHVLQKDEMLFRKNKRLQSVNQGGINPVMGIDSHGAYTGRRIKGTSTPLPSKSIMKQLSIPKDLCTPLALETNGTLFSVSRLLKQGGDSKKLDDGKRKFLDVWSRRVASSAKPSACQVCDCLPYTDGSSRITCEPCISPSIEQFLQEWDKFLEAATLEDIEEADESDGLTDSEEITEAYSIATKFLEEQEAERAVLNRIRGMPAHSRALPQGI